MMERFIEKWLVKMMELGEIAKLNSLIVKKRQYLSTIIAVRKPIIDFLSEKNEHGFDN